MITNGISAPARSGATTLGGEDREMSTELRVLIVDDLRDDALLLARELGKQGLDIEWERVETADTMRAALKQPWDVVLSDYAMPKFGASAALEVLQESGVDIPFIVISGTVGEDVAVKLMRAGAHDYLMKNKLARLGQAVLRETQQAAVRREHRNAERAVARQRRIIELRNQISSIFLTAPPESVHDKVLEAVLGGLDSTLGYFGYIDDAGDIAYLAMTPGAWDQCQVAGKNASVHPEARNRARCRSWRKQRSVIVDEGTDLPEGHLPFQSAIGVPMVHGDALIGRFVVANKPGGYDERDRDLLDGVVAQIAPILSAQQTTTRQKTAHDQLQEQYLQSQKMESVGRLAGGIAHDFNNLLTVINSYAVLAVEGLRDGDPLKTDVQEILVAGQRAATLTRQLLAFSRKQILKPMVLDLNDLVGGVEKMLGRIIGEDIELQIVVGDGLGKVTGDPGQLEQVLMNLVVNARDAMPKGGRLTIETANVELDAPPTVDHPSGLKGSYVMLSVTDDGVGMTDEVRRQVFDPFYTTKKVGEGTGLGLATVYGIVKQSEGEIYLDSEPGRGATFRVYLPRVAETHEAPRRPDTGEYVLRGTETVLVVEDDEAVRNLTGRILASAGYTVVTAAGGGEALLECEQNGSNIQLVLTDVVMPKMSGIEIRDRLAVSFPSLKVLFMSGYSADAMVHSGLGAETDHLIDKPFSPKDLLKKVRMVLDGDR